MEYKKEELQNKVIELLQDFNLKLKAIETKYDCGLVPYVEVENWQSSLKIFIGIKPDVFVEPKPLV